MYPCRYPGCNEKFENHTFLMSHILRDHGNSRLLAAVVAIVLALALASLHLVSAQDAPQPQPTPSVGEPPTMLHLVYLPFVASDNGVKAAVSWCPSCRY